MNSLTYNKEYINKLVDDILEFEDSTDFDLLVGLSSREASRNEMYSRLIDDLSRWFFYLRCCVDEEEYELANKITRIIDLEGSNFLMTIKTFCPWYNNLDKKLVAELITNVKIIYNI